MRRVLLFFSVLRADNSMKCDARASLSCRWRASIPITMGLADCGSKMSMIYLDLFSARVYNEAQSRFAVRGACVQEQGRVAVISWEPRCCLARVHLEAQLNALHNIVRLRGKVSEVPWQRWSASAAARIQRLQAGNVSRKGAMPCYRATLKYR